MRNNSHGAGSINALSIFLLPLILFASTPLSAQIINNCQKPGTCAAQTVNFTPVVAPFIASVFPMTPLKPGLMEISIAPGVFSASENKDAGQGGVRGFDVHGEGASSSFVYGFNSHLGISVIASYEKSHGSAPLLVQFGANNSLIAEFDGVLNQRAYVTMASLIYDPFTNPDGFRLPIFIGYGLYHSADTRTQTVIISGNKIHAETDVNSDGASLALGLAPSLMTWKLRWTLFALAMNGGTDNKKATFQNLTSGSTITDSRSESSDTVMTAGLAVTYRPWNLGFVYTPNIAWDKAGKESLYSLKWSHRFGEKL